MYSKDETTKIVMYLEKETAKEEIQINSDVADKLSRMKTVLQRLRQHRVKHPQTIANLSRLIHNAEFFISRQSQILMWLNSNPGAELPTIVDDEGKLQWVSRKARRELRKRGRK